MISSNIWIKEWIDLKKKWTVEKLIDELKCYPQNYEVALAVRNVEAPLDEVELDLDGDEKIILSY